MNVKIVADSTCDLSADLIEKYDITIIPLCIVMGENSYFDGIETTPEEIYKWADANKTTPKTAAVAIDNAASLLKPFMDEGREIVFFGISSQMSTTCNVVRLIGEEAGYDKLHVIDSQSLSTGIGLQVLYAARLSMAGESAASIVEKAEKRRSAVSASFVIDTLTYLSRGGRCNSVTALLANTLKLKPEIVVKDGAMIVAKKYRGQLGSVLLKYTKDQEEALLAADKNCVFITHSGCSDDIVAPIKEYLESLSHFENIYVTRAGGVVSSHCGPGTLGVLYYTDGE
ncbi:MAG: DegV family protein [Lachnospiraceae bacterium]|nr:DegV family protein [Lachnospiraceae bacterium]